MRKKNSKKLIPAKGEVAGQARRQWGWEEGSDWVVVAATVVPVGRMAPTVHNTDSRRLLEASERAAFAVSEERLVQPKQAIEVG